jgi:hypothetical protein
MSAGERFMQFISLATIGGLVGGIMAGVPYATLSHFVMMLYAIIFFKVGKGYEQDLINPFVFSLCMLVFSVFALQWMTILLTGDTLFPSVWWVVHALNAVIILYLLRK